MPTGGLTNDSGGVSILALVVVTGVVVSAVGTGVVAAEAGGTDPDIDAVIVDDGNYFVGQVLYTGRFDPGDEVTLSYTNGTFVTEVTLKQNGDAVIRTARYGAGKFVLENLDGESVRFDVNRQLYQLDVGSRVVKNDGRDTETTVRIDSNRARYDHVVTADGMSASRLREVFAVGQVDDADDDGTEELLLPTGSTEETYDLDFQGVDPGNYTFEFRVLDTGEVATVEFDVELYPSGNATFEVGSEPLRLQQAAERTVRGTSSLPDGTRLRVVLRNAGGQGFRRSASVLVTDGAFDATFDLTGVPVGQEFVLTVTQQSVVRDRVDGEVVGKAAIRFDDQVYGGDERVELRQVTVPRGGFVAIVVGGERVLGRTGYLEAGSHDGVVVELEEPIDPARNTILVELYEDADGDGTLDRNADEAYTLPEGAVTELLTVRERPETPTETTVEGTQTTEETTDPPTTEDTTVATTEETVEATTEDTGLPDTTSASGGSGPGFGVLAAVAGVAAALIAVRFRRR